VEVGSSNLAARWQLESAISTAPPLLYVKSHHCVQKGMLSIEDFRAGRQAHNLPLIVDAAAEEDLRRWVASGADMVIYSGAKAFNAPPPALSPENAPGSRPVRRSITALPGR
jgi:D-glucosaminate-6-phosphate ammonia-lyase